MNNVDNSLNNIYSKVSDLENEISKIEKGKADRLVLTNGIWKSISINEPGARDRFEDTIDQINNLLKEIKPVIEKARPEDFFRLQELKAKLKHVDTWLDKSVQKHQSKHWNFLRHIPVIWRFAHGIDKTKAETVHNQIIAIDKALNKSFGESLEEIKTEFLNTMQVKMNNIQNAVQVPKNNVGELKEVLLNVSSELKGFNDSAVKKIIRFSQESLKNSDKFSLTASDLVKIDDMIKEMAKVTDSAVYFLENSLNDENTIFHTPWPDQESGTNSEPLIDSVIHKRLMPAKKMVKDCQNIIDSAAGHRQKDLPRLSLSFLRTEEIMKSCRDSLNNELKPLPDNSFEVRKGQLTFEIYELQNERNSISEKIKTFSGSDNSELNDLKINLKKVDGQIDRKNSLLIKVSEKEIAFSKASKELDELELQFQTLSHDLKELGLLTVNHKPAGEISFRLTNPVIEGSYQIPAEQIMELADAYSDKYIESLLSLKKGSAEATMKLSQLRENILEKLILEESRDLPAIEPLILEEDLPSIETLILPSDDETSQLTENESKLQNPELIFTDSNLPQQIKNIEQFISSQEVIADRKLGFADKELSVQLTDLQTLRNQNLKLNDQLASEKNFSTRTQLKSAILSGYNRENTGILQLKKSLMQGIEQFSAPQESLSAKKNHLENNIRNLIEVSQNKMSVIQNLETHLLDLDDQKNAFVSNFDQSEPDVAAMAEAMSEQIDLIKVEIALAKELIKETLLDIDKNVNSLKKAAWLAEFQEEFDHIETDFKQRLKKI